MSETYGKKLDEWCGTSRSPDDASPPIDPPVPRPTDPPLPIPTDPPMPNPVDPPVI